MTDEKGKELVSPEHWGKDVLEVARLGIGPGGAVYASVLTDSEKTDEEVEFFIATLVNGLLMTAFTSHYPREELETLRARGKKALQKAFELLEAGAGKSSLSRLSEN